MIIKSGWYQVKIENNSPTNKEVRFYNEWVERCGDKWDLSGMGDVSVVNIIKAESDDKS
jgi:hypothetical protein